MIGSEGRVIYSPMVYHHVTVFTLVCPGGPLAMTASKGQTEARDRVRRALKGRHDDLQPASLHNSPRRISLLLSC